MAEQDQDNLAAEWAAALEKDSQEGQKKDSGVQMDEDALAAEWAAALEEDGGDKGKGGDQDDIADAWAAALADEEEQKIEKEQKQRSLSAKSKDYEYKDLTSEAKNTRPEGGKRDLDFILDIPLNVTAQLGSTRLLINELLQLGQGSVIELNKLAGEPLEVHVNGKLVARGEAVVINEKFGVRLTDIISPIERVRQLG
ncbi:MAG: flagellar motor switch protein FliN [Deltaproteobacteria bacterium]|nr:flagellar motor switch protein FliN [Deltaproteobacteria bacterium]